MIKFISNIYPRHITNLIKQSTSKSSKFIIDKRITQLTLNYFSKSKKEKPQLKVPTIHISKFNQQQDGFVLYQNRQGMRIKLISLAFLLCFASGYYTYTKLEDDQIKINYMIMGALMAIPFLMFQFRTQKTLKSLILDKQGQQIVITRFKLGGFRQESTKAKVEVLRGISKAFVFGGSVIKGGGVYGLEQRDYWFQSRYITDPIIFQQVAQGNKIKIDRSKVY